MSQSPFNANPELVAMKEEIAERGLRIKLTGLAITAAFFAGALFLPGLAPMTTTYDGRWWHCLDTDL
jgi:hypothetical protein